MPRRKRGPGRPAILDDPAKRKVLLDALSAGVPVTHAAALAGIAGASVRSWAAQGAAARERVDTSQPPAHHDERYLAFLADVERARATVSERAVAQIQRAAQGGYVRKTRVYWDPMLKQSVTETDYAEVDWRAASWLLERAFRAEFGKSTYVDVNMLGEGLSLGSPAAVAGPSDEATAVLAARVAAWRERAALRAPEQSA